MLVTVIPKKREPLENLTPAIGASGPHDFAVRFSRARQSQPSRPPHPDPRFVTNAHTPLWWDGMAIEVKLICPRDQARPLRHIGTTGKSAKCCQGLFCSVILRTCETISAVILRCAPSSARLEGWCSAWCPRPSFEARKSSHLRMTSEIASQALKTTVPSLRARCSPRRSGVVRGA